MPIMRLPDYHGLGSDCRQRHGNLLLNLSPDTAGRLADETVDTLQEAARIIKRKS